jgi:CHASE3 domain sensor protein
MTKNPNSRRPRSTFPSNTVRLASLLVVIVTIMGLGALAYFTERGIGVSRDWEPPTYQGRSQIGDLQLEIMRAHANETAYVLTAG